MLWTNNWLGIRQYAGDMTREDESTKSFIKMCLQNVNKQVHNTTEGDQTDSDGDGILDTEDNCPSIPNQDQLDSNDNNIGDACDQEQEIPPTPPEDESGEEAPPPDEPEPEQPEPEQQQDEGDGDEGD